MSQAIRVRASGIVVQDDAVLLIECRDDVVGLHYNLPGGGVEPREAVIDAVRREVYEETGLRVGVGRLLLAIESRPTSPLADQPHSIGLVFACEARNGHAPDVPAHPDLYETGLRWVPVDDLPTLPLLPNVGADLRAVLRGDLAAGSFVVSDDDAYLGRFDGTQA